jgi:arsenical pump membrane protein
VVSASLSNIATWSIALFAVAGVITRPGNWSEAWWAVCGALTLVLLSLVPMSDALAAVERGTDVYLFLTGMMLLAELARREGLFDWLAAYALLHAGGSGRRLFLLVYGVGSLVTIFLSNDATAVVLTPAVYAAAKRAGAPALPYLFICAFIANAASFVLPISNPANLLVFGDHIPPLGVWLMYFAAPSVTAILLTYVLLRFAQRKHIPEKIASGANVAVLHAGGRIAAAAIGTTGIVLLIASFRAWPLGAPTCIAGVTAWLVISAMQHKTPWPVLKNISWSVLPLVAALFVLVGAVEYTGIFHPLAILMSAQSVRDPVLTCLAAGSISGLASNFVNNLPAGLIAATLAQAAHLAPRVTGALLIGVDLGPNLSITGSLATILWLVAIRRERENVRALQFLAIGAVVMPPTLIATLGAFVRLG